MPKFTTSSPGSRYFFDDFDYKLRNALKKRFPDSCLLFCIFHMLQQIWRWLYDQLHNIRADDRVEIMKRFRQILYCETEVELQNMCAQFLNSSLIKK